ncbi:MAG: A24 family peptidase [Abditibacteriaceae bacterium]
MDFFFTHFSGQSIGLPPIGNTLINIALVLLIVICAITDAKEHKIYNKVTFPVMLAGILLNAAFAGWHGLIWGLLGWLVGMAIQWVPFMLGFAKAGDVKLLAAVGALKGWFFCTFGFLFGAIAFGVLMIPWLARDNKLKSVGNNIKNYIELTSLTQKKQDMPQPSVEKVYMPWGVGLAIGFFIALVLEIIFGQAFWIHF